MYVHKISILASIIIDHCDLSVQCWLLSNAHSIPLVVSSYKVLSCVMQHLQREAVLTYVFSSYSLPPYRTINDTKLFILRDKTVESY